MRALTKIDLPSPEYIKQHCHVETFAGTPPKDLLYARKRRMKWKAMGLTSQGKPYKNKLHPELRGIADRNAYYRAWRKLTNYNEKRRKKS